jgi:hypothetical protein
MVAVSTGRVNYKQAKVEERDTHTHTSASNTDSEPDNFIIKKIDRKVKRQQAIPSLHTTFSCPKNSS